MSKFIGVKIRYIGLLLLSFVIVMAYGLWLIDKERSARFNLVSEQISQSAKLISVTQSNLIAKTTLVLEEMSKNPQLTSGDKSCHEVLRNYKSVNFEYSNLGVADTNGVVQCMALDSGAEGINISGFPFFARVIIGEGVVVSDVVISPITKLPTMYFSRAVRDKKGQVIGIFFAALDLKWLNNEVSQYSSLTGSSLSMIDGKGNLLAHFKQESKDKPFLGQVTKTDDELFRNLLTEHSVGTALTKTKDGKEELVGFVNFARTSSGPAYLMISIDKELALTPAIRNFYIQIGLTITLVTLIWLLIYQGGSRIFVTRINAIYQATKRFSAGDFKARVGFKTNADELDSLGTSFDEMAEYVESTHNQLVEMNKLLRHGNRSLKVLSHGNRALLECKTEDELIERVLEGIVRIGEYSVSAIAQLGEEGDVYFSLLEQYPSAGERDSLVDIINSIPPEELGNVVRCMRDQSLISIDSNNIQYPNLSSSMGDYGVKALALLPMTHNHLVNYVLLIGSRTSESLTGDELSYLHESAHDISFGIGSIKTKGERDRLMLVSANFEGSLRDSLESAIAAIAASLEMRDPYTAGHERRVAALATAIARKLGLSEEECHSVYLAAIVHDIGKIKVPAEILVKPARLSEIEYSLVKEHVTASYDILKNIEFPWPIAEIVRQHHERLDGSGYPQGLKKGEILFRSRILAVADVVESMASHRPYRPSLGMEAALEEVEAGKGIRYDASVVDACVSVIKNDGFAWQH